MARTLHQVRRRLQDLIFQEVPARRRPRRMANYLLRLGLYMVRELSQDNCLQRAAALSFTTILSLVPVTALFVLSLKMFGKLDVLSGKVQAWVLSSFVAGAAQGVADYIDQFVATLHTRALGTIGAIGMVFVAYSLFRTVEKSLNGIWKVTSHRSFMARFQILCSLLIVIPVFLTASIYFSGKVQGLKFVGEYTDVALLSRTFLTAAPFLFTTVSLLALFVLVPNTKVRMRSAIFAAVFAAILFETAKSGFNLYVIRVIPYSKIYGSLGLFPIFMLWIYLSWIIVLFGVELSYTIQNVRVLDEKELDLRMDRTLNLSVHEEWGLRIFRALIQQFQNGKSPVPLEAIASQVELRESQIQEHVELLVQEKILARVETEETSGYLPMKPLEQITNAEIENVFRKQLGLPTLTS